MNFFCKKHSNQKMGNIVLLSKTSIFLILGLVFFNFVYADFSSTSFTLENPINFIEGGQSSSSSFQYISATGQTAQGQSTSLSFGQNAGFLYFPDEVIVTPPGGGGGGGGGSKVGLNFNCRIADFNCDTQVNIFDLSILLYYLERSGPEVAPYDLSKDSLVDFIDTSIVFYYWDVEN
jgi:hypothetical protein